MHHESCIANLLSCSLNKPYKPKELKEPYEPQKPYEPNELNEPKEPYELNEPYKPNKPLIPQTHQSAAGDARARTAQAGGDHRVWYHRPGYRVFFEEECSRFEALYCGCG